MKINCAHDELRDVDALVPNPRNPNQHPKKQIKRLAKLIEFQGQRHPIIISNQSGFVVVGHGRLDAIKLLGWPKCAVNYQDFENEAQEYAFMVSDNAIAEWADQDLEMVTKDLADFGPEFTDLELLGLESIEDLTDLFKEESPAENKPKMVKCPNCGEHFDGGKHKVKADE